MNYFRFLKLTNQLPLGMKIKTHLKNTRQKVIKKIGQHKNDKLNTESLRFIEGRRKTVQPQIFPLLIEPLWCFHKSRNYRYI